MVGILQTLADDAAAFAAANAPSDVEVIATKRGQFRESIVRIDLPSLLLHRHSANLPALIHVRHPPFRAYISFVPLRRAPSVKVDGMELKPGQLVQYGSGLGADHHSDHPREWASLSLALDDADAGDAGFAQYALEVPAQTRIVSPQPARFERLRMLHARAIDCVRQDPGILAESEPARGLEQSLLHSVVECLDSGDAVPDTGVRARHAKVISRFRDLLDANMDRALYVPEVCSALGVSHRTLSYCCQDFLGMAPKRYFFLRRMALARQALHAIDPHAATVTEIATRYGFWELGRFSVHYRTLFGESPSATLRRNGNGGPG